MNNSQFQKESNFVSAIIYLHDKGGNVEHFLDMVYNVLDSYFDHYELICVDDCCDNDTVNLVRNFSRKMEKAAMTVVHTGRYQGLERAMIAGMSYAIGDYVFEFDSTAQSYEPYLILDIYQKALEGNDIVSAVPTSCSKGLSQAFYSLINRYGDLPVMLSEESVRVISRRAINRVYDVNKKILFRKIAYASSGLRSAKVFFNPKFPREKASNKEEIRNRWNTGIDAIVLYTDVAFKFSAVCSMLFAAFSLCVALYTVGVFVLGRPIEGWTTTMLLISLAFLGLFVILTCMVKYLSLIIKLQVLRKEYTIESIEKVSN